MRIPWLWAVAGAAWTITFLSFAGPFFLPVALAATYLAVRGDRRTGDRTLRWPAFVGGIGALLLAIGLLHLPEDRCPAGGSLPPSTGAEVVSCSTFDPVPWFLAGAVVVVVAVAAGRRRVRRVREDPST